MAYKQKKIIKPLLITLGVIIVVLLLVVIVQKIWRNIDANRQRQTDLLAQEEQQQADLLLLKLENLKSLRQELVIPQVDLNINL